MSLTNSCRFIGRLGKDPESEHTPRGAPKLRFSLAVETRKKIDGEWDTVTEWIYLVAYGNNAENMEEYASKGDLIVFETHFEERTWEDDDGNKRRAYDFVVEFWKILSRAQRSEDEYYEDDEEEYEVDENEDEDEEEETLSF